MEKVEHGAEEEFEALFKSGEDLAPYLSGVTVNPVVQGSSLMGGDGT